MTFDKVKDKFDKLDLVACDEFQACTESEVNVLEKTLSHPLPQAYRNFLLWMGHGAGSFWQGSHCFYEQLVDIQKEAILLLQENNFPQQIPRDAFVFWMHQGYMFAFFRLSEGDDPSVYFYYAPKQPTDFELSWDHFSEFILAEAESHKNFEMEVQKAIEMMKSFQSEDDS